MLRAIDASLVFVLRGAIVVFRAEFQVFLRLVLLVPTDGAKLFPLRNDRICKGDFKK